MVQQCDYQKIWKILLSTILPFNFDIWGTFWGIFILLSFFFDGNKFKILSGIKRSLLPGKSMSLNWPLYIFFPAWAFLSGIGGDRMVKPEDAYAFQNTMLICIGVGFFASIGYHVITKLPYSNGNIDGDWLAPPSPLLPPLTPSPVQSNATRYVLNI